MSKSTKIVLSFAIVGFTIPLLLLGCYAVANSFFNTYPNPMLLLFLCPASIAAMVLDNAPWYEGILVWPIIAAINAALYAAIPVVIVFFYRSFRRDDRDPYKRWLS